MKIVVELNEKEFQYTIRKLTHGVSGHDCKKTRYLKDVYWYHYRRENHRLLNKFLKAKQKKDRALKKIGTLQKEISGIRKGVKN